MTRRGKLTLALGLLAYVVAWAFGSKALYPVAIGLVLAPLGAPGLGAARCRRRWSCGGAPAAASTSRGRTSG